MSGSRDEGATADRRWLIGIAITLFFGLFGVVMALLSYSDRTKPSAPALTPSETTAPPPAKPTMAPATPTTATVAPAAVPSVSTAPIAPAASSSATDTKKKKHSK